MAKKRTKSKKNVAADTELPTELAQVEVIINKKKVIVPPHIAINMNLTN